MGGNYVWLRCMLLLWHLCIYYNNYNSTLSLTLKVVLRKSGGAARLRRISPRPPTRTRPHPTCRPEELGPSLNNGARCVGPLGLTSHSHPHSHDPNRSRQEAREQRPFPSCILRRMEGNRKFPRVVLGARP